MKRLIARFCLPACLLLSSQVALSAGAAERVRLTGDLPLAPGAPVQIEIPTAELRLESHDGDRLQVEMVVTCNGDPDKCRRAMADVALASNPQEGRPVTWLGGAEAASGEEEGRAVQGPLRTCRASGLAGGEGWPWPDLITPGRRMALDLTFRYPAERALEISLKEGNVTLEGLRSTAHVRVDQGRVRILFLESDAGSIHLESREGFTELRRPGEPTLQGAPQDTTIFGTKLHWQGEGAVDLQVEVKKGDVRVRLH